MPIPSSIASETDGFAYYAKVENIASKDDPIDQSQSYLEAQEKLISKTYGAKGNDVYRDGFYRTVSDVFKKDLGPEPRSDWYDGGIRQIGDPVIASMHDPKSYKFVHFTTETVQYQKTWCWKVDYYFRGKNAFGALILSHVLAYVRQGQLIAINQATLSDD